MCRRKQGAEILLQKNHSSVGWEILPFKSHMLWNVQGEIVSVGSWLSKVWNWCWGLLCKVLGHFDSQWSEPKCTRQHASVQALNQNHPSTPAPLPGSKSSLPTSPSSTAGSLRPFPVQRHCILGTGGVFDIFHSACQGHLQSASECYVGLRRHFEVFVVEATCAGKMCLLPVPEVPAQLFPSIMWQWTTLLNPLLLGAAGYSTTTAIISIIIVIVIWKALHPSRAQLWRRLGGLSPGLLVTPYWPSVAVSATTLHELLCGNVFPQATHKANAYVLIRPGWWM